MSEGWTPTMVAMQVTLLMTASEHFQHVQQTKLLLWSQCKWPCSWLQVNIFNVYEVQHVRGNLHTHTTSVCVWACMRACKKKHASECVVHCRTHIQKDGRNSGSMKLHTCCVAYVCVCACVRVYVCACVRACVRKWECASVWVLYFKMHIQKDGKNSRKYEVAYLSTGPCSFSATFETALPAFICKHNSHQTGAQVASAFLMRTSEFWWNLSFWFGAHPPVSVLTHDVCKTIPNHDSFVLLYYVIHRDCSPHTLLYYCYYSLDIQINLEWPWPWPCCVVHSFCKIFPEDVCVQDNTKQWQFYTI